MPFADASRNGVGKGFAKAPCGLREGSASSFFHSRGQDVLFGLYSNLVSSYQSMTAVDDSLIDCDNRNSGPQTQLTTDVTDKLIDRHRLL